MKIIDVLHSFAISLKSSKYVLMKSYILTFLNISLQLTMVSCLEKSAVSNLVGVTYLDAKSQVGVFSTIRH